MKKSLVINSDKNKVASLAEKFMDYIPENNFEKITTLGLIDYDYLYIINFEENTLENFVKIFKDTEEAFYIDCNCFNNTELENLYLAFKKANYSYKLDKNFNSSNATFDFINNTCETKNIEVIANSIDLCKDLINKPSNILSTTSFTNKLEQLAAENHLDIQIFYKKQLEEMGAGGILAVNKGSNEEARIVELKYNGSASNKVYTLVGKGIVFDSGGYSLKSVPGIKNMKSDMGGAAVVTSIITAVAELKLPVNLTAIIPITDNLIGPDAYRPDDVITFMNGITTEIITTDAEGRLILADSLVYASKQRPELIIDIATLTGAIEAALGNKTTGVFGNNLNYINKFINNTEQSGEYAWHMPINNSHREQIKGNVAQIKNAASPAGACTAAAFLEKFVNDNNWIHLDIAGSSWDDKIGATGAIVRPLIKFFETLEEDNETNSNRSKTDK